MPPEAIKRRADGAAEMLAACREAHDMMRCVVCGRPILDDGVFLRCPDCIGEAINVAGNNPGGSGG